MISTTRIDEMIITKIMDQKVGVKVAHNQILVSSVIKEVNICMRKPQGLQEKPLAEAITNRDHKRLIKYTDV